MSLTRAEYDGIMRAYEERREDARHRVEENKKQVFAVIPEYRTIENKIVDLAMESAVKAIDGDESAVSFLRDEIDSLTSKQRALLKENGFADDFLEVKYACPDCRDTGYTDDGRKCHCLTQTMIRHLYRQSNIEEVLKRENFDTLRYDIYTDSECEKMKPIIDRCRRFADDFGRRYENILLLGSVGVGKTFLTNCMAKQIIDNGYSVIYFTSMRLFDTLSRELYKKEEDGSRDIREDIYTCDLLIIDDLGTESVSSFVAQRLFDIVNERDLRKKPCVISTNLSFEELDRRYSERNFSRIFGNYEILHPDVEDIRIRMRRSAR